MISLWRVFLWSSRNIWCDGGTVGLSLHQNSFAASNLRAIQLPQNVFTWKSVSVSRVLSRSRVRKIHSPLCLSTGHSCSLHRLQGNERSGSLWLESSLSVLACWLMRTAATITSPANMFKWYQMILFSTKRRQTFANVSRPVAKVGFRPVQKCCQRGLAFSSSRFSCFISGSSTSPCCDELSKVVHQPKKGDWHKKCSNCVSVSELCSPPYSKSAFTSATFWKLYQVCKIQPPLKILPWGQDLYKAQQQVAKKNKDMRYTPED